MNTKHSKLVEAVRAPIRSRDDVQEDINRRRATREAIENEIPKLKAEKEALETRFAEDDTECAVAGLDLPTRTPEDTATQLAIDRNIAGKGSAIGVLDQQIERRAGDLLEHDVAVSDAFLGWAGVERQAHASAIVSALEKIANHAAQLRAVDLIQEALLGSPFRFTQPESEWALTSGKWLSDKLAGLPPELRPASLSSDRLEEVARQHAAESLAAIKEDK